jgi:hypothetical protein
VIKPLRDVLRERFHTPADVVHALGLTKPTVAVAKDAWNVIADALLNFAQDAQWEESKHPRGQPDNAGQFGPGGGGEKSGTEGEKSLEKPANNTPTMAGRGDEVLFNAKAVADRQGFDSSKISISDEVKTFKLGDVEYKYAGAAFLKEGTITLYPNVIHPGTTIGITAHEIMHQKWQAIFDAYVAERDAASAKSSELDWNDRLLAPMKPDGSLRDEAKKDYPIYAKFEPILRDQSKFYKDDGVTEYSKAYWNLWNKGEMRTDLAFHETLAEMARLHLETDQIPGTGRWQRLYKAVLSTYPKVKKRA